MALIQLQPLNPEGGVYKVFLWEGATNGGTPDTFEPIRLDRFQDISIYAFGTFGASAAIAIHGGPEINGSPTLFAALSDLGGTAISLSAPGAAIIGPNAIWYKPVLTAGDGSTDIDVYLVVA